MFETTFGDLCRLLVPSGRRQQHAVIESLLWPLCLISQAAFALRSCLVGRRAACARVHYELVRLDGISGPQWKL